MKSYWICQVKISKYSSFCAAGVSIKFEVGSQFEKSSQRY